MPDKSRKIFGFILSNFLYLLVIFIFVFWIRGSMVGSYPCTDEGIWAYYSMITNHVIETKNQFTTVGYLNLYPTICSFVFNLDMNPFLSLRIIDLFFTFLSFYTLFLICQKYTNNKILSLFIIIPFIFVINNPKYIQAGFKNSIIISSFFIYLSYYLFLINSKGKNILHFLCGFSLMLSVLLREFHIFICIFLFLLYISKSKNKILSLFLGIVVSLFITLLGLFWLRGINLIDQLYDGYSKQAKFYKQNQEKIYENLENSFNIFLLDLWVIVPFIIFITFNLINFRSSSKIILSFILCSFLLMVEPFLKVCFPYHLCSFYFLVPIFTSQLHFNYFKNIKRFFKQFRAVTLVILIFFSYYSIHINHSSILYRYKNNTLPNLKSLFNGKWNCDNISKSHYLIVSNVIKLASKPLDTLCVSGYAHVLFPLTGLYPADSKFEDLYYAYLSLGENKLKHDLIKHSPNFIYLSKRDSFLYPKILSIIDRTKLYKKIDEYPINKTIHYGQFSATLYKLKT